MSYVYIENKTNPRPRMHYVYLCHVRLSTSLVNDLVKDRSQRRFDSRENEPDMT